MKNNVFSFLTSPLRGLFSGGYEASVTTDERKDPPFIVADGRQELSSLSRLKLISKTRDLVRNFGFAREQVNAMEIYAVGDGIFPQPGTASDEWNTRAEKLFRTAFARPESSGRFSFGKLTRLVCRALDTDGEIFFVKIAGDVDNAPKLQTFEAHRVAPDFDPMEGLFDGIRFNAQGAPIGYRFVLDNGEVQEFAAENVIHVFAADRPSDAHGVPQLQHAVNALLDTREILATEKRGVKTINELTFAITSERAFSGATGGDYLFGGENMTSGTDPDALKRQIGGGKVGKLAPGEKLETVNTNRPSPTFTGFLDYILRDASLGNVPYEFVADSSKIGGAGVRLVVGRAARVFSRRQEELIEFFLDPVWKFFVGWAITTGRLPEIEDCFEVEWACPKSVSVDAGREAAQDRADVEGGFCSLSDYYAERGMKYRDEVRRIAADIRLARQTAEEFGVPPETVYSKLGYKTAVPAAPEASASAENSAQHTNNSDAADEADDEEDAADRADREENSPKDEDDRGDDNRRDRNA